MCHLYRPGRELHWPLHRPWADHFHLPHGWIGWLWVEIYWWQRRRPLGLHPWDPRVRDTRDHLVLRVDHGHADEMGGCERSRLLLRALRLEYLLRVCHRRRHRDLFRPVGQWYFDAHHL